MTGKEAAIVLALCALTVLAAFAAGILTVGLFR